ncbi:LCP family protein [Vallicoccus soli]|uniref:LytR family transcriptional regulator n=1 Tax=Vallicoccus soli TaxID=2339232 RepID=A0A3A3YV20_9ACTN|nr:LCP family protein [Vallicoccus soli]RJK95360.1 LytR family transcriptional regulator [Vallicoccus soli]
MDRPLPPPARHRAGDLPRRDRRPVQRQEPPAAGGRAGGRGPRPRGASALPLDEPAALRVRRAVALLVMSALAPGSAQAVRGGPAARRLGRAALRCWVALLAVAALLGLGALVLRDTVLSLAVRPWALESLRAVLVVVAAGWAVLLLDALRLGRPVALPRGARRGVAGLTAVMLVVGAGPLVYGARSTGIQLDLVTSVFAEGDVVTDDGRMNVLLMGGDAGESRVGLRPDSLTLVSVDTASGEATMVSLPRNLQHARFRDGSPMDAEFPDGFDDLLNAVYTYGSEHPDLYPDARDPGAEATKDAVAGVLGLPVHYYAVVDLKGFRSMVDALGGLRIDVQERVPIGGGTSPVTGWIEPGEQVLDGYHALWYARSREGSSDYARMGRQRCVLSALAGQADPVTVVRRFREVADSAKELVATDLPRSALPDLVELALRSRASGSSLRSVTLAPPLITPADPDFERIHELALEALGEEPAPAEDVQALPAAPPAGAGGAGGAGEGGDGGSAGAGAASGGTGGADGAATGEATGEEPDAPASPCG